MFCSGLLTQIVYVKKNPVHVKNCIIKPRGDDSCTLIIDIIDDYSYFYVFFI